MLEIAGALHYAPERNVVVVHGQGFRVFKRGFKVKKFAFAFLLTLLACFTVLAQGKGVDKQSERVRGGNADTPANNGAKQNTGAGSGIDFGKGKAHPLPPLPNPYRLGGRRDTIVAAIQNLMRDRKLIVDDAASKPTEGIIVSQPFRFIKGAVVTQSELGRYAVVSTTSARGWTQGRYTITVEVQPIDGANCNVTVNAKIEGRTDGATGPEWVTLSSIGIAEEEFLSALIESVTGAPPLGRAPSQEP